ncbi:hypothetical protein ACFOTA_02965 [Chitinophaga sp. GCM10012297]|uniref:Uncharacterized protein n=1 Tax=Chitinophaga chungangae TaxID=2821488 RepID=A0ABS3Y8Z5_9BACT|nr:hypothetical protein [Chitinophaga chungangae]MBO9151152.1 hypothetical protein [Chitinophaga chungangae]
MRISGKILLIVILVSGWMLTSVKTARAQCDWSAQAVTDSSRCAASGKITILLTGPDKDNVTNKLYKLKSASGLEYPEIGTPVFENLAAGEYSVLVSGICGGQLDSVMVLATVPGNYVPFSGDALKVRDPFPNCNSGQVKLTFTNGRKPYRATITAAPGTYTGAAEFFSSNLELIVGDLPTGNYTFVLSDSCGIGSEEEVSMGTVPEPTLTSLNLHSMSVTQQNCNKLVVPSPPISSASAYAGYVYAGSGFQYGAAWPGQTPAAYHDVYYGNTLLLDLPAGETASYAYGKVINYYIKSPCGQIWILPYTVNPPLVNVTQVKNCNIDFGLACIFSFMSDRFCMPMQIKVRNRNTLQEWNFTVYDPNGWSEQGFPYGIYDIDVRSADNYPLYTADSLVIQPEDPASQYSIYFTAQTNGMHNSALVTVNMRSGLSWAAGDVIELVAPATHRARRVVPFAGSGGYLFYESDNGLPFTPNNYVWKITDRCGSHYINMNIAPEDVYFYEWDYSTSDTCGGMAVRGNGTVKFHGQVRPTYYKITSSPPGIIVDQSIVPAGSPLTLPAEGNYKISVTASPTSVSDWDNNTMVVNYAPKRIAIDATLTSGFICPQGAPNSGSIVVHARNGTGGYQYMLAEAGNGLNGPYLDANNTGRFFSGSGYSLMVNENYDVKVVDGCGAFAVQTVKILDYATAQLAMLDKETYCVGDVARLNVLQLPTTAITYRWAFPDGAVDTAKAPVIRDLGPQHRGIFKVAISADICQDTIRGEVTLDLADFERICYSSVTDTSVNPYTAGLLGNWRAFKSYAYYGARKESDPGQPTNTRTDGTYQDFLSFWQKQQNGWKASQDTTRWLWTTESTLFNKKGYELENKDPLGRFNAAIYGFENTLAVAVVQNSRYREAAFEGFEDYDLASDVCEMDCSAGRRFDFSGYLGMLDSTQRHTGRYSMRLAAGDTMFTSHAVTDTGGAATLPVFVTGAAQCSTPGLVLKSVKADSTVLLPSFSPLTGKKVLFSAWVKEQADCNCSAYSSNVVKLVIKKGEETFIHTVQPSGNIIEGWQRYEYAVDVPAGSSQISVLFIATGTSDIFIDDVRFHPYNANMKSYAYDPMTMRMMAELDENNYATFYEYDDDGVLIRVKKETERGIKTIKETRSGLIKE